MILFENLQHAQVRESARESAPKGQPDAWSADRDRFTRQPGLEVSLH
jgi:hypothetical protein